MSADPRPVVSNTTPVSSLLHLDQLNLLSSLFGRVLIPEDVARELDRGRPLFGDWRTRAGAAALQVVSPMDGPFLRELQKRLDSGEAAAIALSVERSASLVLLDEAAARGVALHHRLRVTGTLGVLLEAKRRGLVDRLRPLIEQLDKVNFHMSPALKTEVLRSAGELG